MRIRRVNVYCGWYRNTVVKCRPGVLPNGLLQIKCIECKGTGKVHYINEEYEADCVPCKGTGKQYL